MIEARQFTKSHNLLRILTGAVLGLVLVWGLQWGRPVLIPIAVAGLLTLLLTPVVHRLNRWGLPHVVAVLISVTAAYALLVLLGWVMTSQVAGMLRELPKNTETIKTKIRTLRAFGNGTDARRFTRMVDEISREVVPAPVAEKTRKTEEAAPAASGDDVPWLVMTGYLGSAIEVLGAAAFAMILVVFFLLEGREIRDRLAVLAGRARLTVTSKALDEISNRITRYLGMVAILNGGFGLVLAGLLAILGVPYAFLWGAVAGAMRFIPYIGPWVGALFPITMSLAVSTGSWQPIAVSVTLVILELVTNNLIEPFVFGRTTGVSPTALLISAAFWLYLWGPLGLVLSIPFLVCLAVIGKNIRELRFLNLLLSDEPAMAADASFYHRLLRGDAVEALAVAVAHMQTKDRLSLYDEVLLPALKLTKEDRRRGLLSAEEYTTTLQAMRVTLEEIDRLPKPEKDDEETSELNSANAQLDANRSQEKMLVTGCVLADAADHLALELLRRLMKPHGYDVILQPARGINHLLQMLATQHPRQIVLVAMPPTGLRTVREICRRVRQRLADSQLIVARWGASDEQVLMAENLTEQGADHITTTLRETMTVLLTPEVEPAQAAPHPFEISAVGSQPA